MANLTSIELCAGAGGQALGLEQAGFSHEALVEVDSWCRKTLILNRPGWNVLEGEQADLRAFDAKPYKGVDVVAGGVPCAPKLGVVGMGRIHGQPNLVIWARCHNPDGKPIGNHFCSPNTLTLQ